MAKTKQEWLYQLRRCSSVNTLEKIIHKNRDSLSTSERESFNSAADHRGSDSNLLIVFYVQIMPDDLVMQLHRF